jgi:hypothetical protein
MSANEGFEVAIPAYIPDRTIEKIYTIMVAYRGCPYEVILVQIVIALEVHRGEILKHGSGFMDLARSIASQYATGFPITEVGI